MLGPLWWKEFQKWKVMESESEFKACGWVWPTAATTDTRGRGVRLTYSQKKRGSLLKEERFQAPVWPPVTASSLTSQKGSNWSMTAAFHQVKATFKEHVLTSSRQLLGIDNFGGVFLPSGDLHATPHHRKSSPGEELEKSLVRFSPNMQPWLTLWYCFKRCLEPYSHTHTHIHPWTIPVTVRVSCTHECVNIQTLLCLFSFQSQSKTSAAFQVSQDKSNRLTLKEAEK